MVQQFDNSKFSRNMIKKINDQINDPCIYNMILLDTSGSMRTCDGKKIGQNDYIYKCTRIEEARVSMEYLVDIARTSYNPIGFYFFDGSIIEIKNSSSNECLNKIKNKINEEPEGLTPLCYVLTSILDKINFIDDNKDKNINKYIVTIITDGCASDGNLNNIIFDKKYKKILGKINFVINLCTDDNEICKYWNELDTNPELKLDIVDDFLSESEQIKKKNSFLNYNMSLHLYRLHIIDSIVDMLDEQTLYLTDIKYICKLLIDNDIKNDPNECLDSFKNEIESYLIDIPKVPVYKNLSSYLIKPTDYKPIIITSNILLDDTSISNEIFHIGNFDTYISKIYDFFKSFIREKINLNIIINSCKTFFNKNKFLSIIFIGFTFYCISRIIPFIITMIFYCLIVYILLLFYSHIKFFSE